MAAFVSVYVDMSARAVDVHQAIGQLPMPAGVLRVEVDDSLLTDTFGCRIAVDLTGDFDEQVDGPAIAREYADRLSAHLGVPAYALGDLLRREYPAS
ncbi:MAG: hypothetical protein ABW137_34075 [Mycobacterium sp.]